MLAGVITIPNESEPNMSILAKSVIGLVLAVALVVAVWLIRPVFIDTQVDETFPVVAVSEPAAPAAEPTADPVPTGTAADDAGAKVVTATEVPAEEATANTPVAVTTGQFVGADDRHSGEGDATIYDLSDGSRVLRLENFEVTNGPDLRVYLAPVDRDGQPDLHEGEVNLGRLKGNIGNQNYDIPADFDVDQPLAVVIYCQAFHVDFAIASLA